MSIKVFGLNFAGATTTAVWGRSLFGWRLFSSFCTPRQVCSSSYSDWILWSFRQRRDGGQGTLWKYGNKHRRWISAVVHVSRSHTEI